MQYVMLTLAVAAFLVICGRIWLWRRREAPRRQEIRARPITFQTRLDGVRIMTRRLRWLGADDLVINAPMELIVRDDAFEVSAANSSARAVGLEYYFSAPETSVEVWRRLPRIYGPGSGKEWILLRSRPAGGGGSAQDRGEG